MTHLFVADDLSARSALAARRAAMIARAKGWRMTLGHAIDDDQPEPVVAAHRRAAEAALAQTAERLGGEADCATRVLTGDPAESLARAAREAGAALIVVGPHRRSALRDVFLGTTGERVVRVAHAPVLTVRTEPREPYRRTLLAVDCSQASAAALAAARDLSLTPARDVVALFVVDAPGASALRRGGAARAEIEAAGEAAERAARAELAAFLPRGGFPCGRETLLDPGGSVDAAICAAAERLGCDLIALGTEGRTGLGGFFLGSVARRVLARATVDVLLAPPPRAAATG